MCTSQSRSAAQHQAAELHARTATCAVLPLNATIQLVLSTPCPVPAWLRYGNRWYRYWNTVVLQDAPLLKFSRNNPTARTRHEQHDDATRKLTGRPALSKLAPSVRCGRLCVDVMPRLPHESCKERTQGSPLSRQVLTAPGGNRHSGISPGSVYRYCTSWHEAGLPSCTLYVRLARRKRLLGSTSPSAHSKRPESHSTANTVHYGPPS